MEGVRSDATKASKVIAMAMSGAVPLREIATGEVFERRSSTSAATLGKKGTKKGTKKGAKSTAEMMGLTSRGEDGHGEHQRSRSAGDNPESAGGDYSFNEFDGEGGGDATFATAGQNGSDEPLPYVSPYTLPQA